MSSVGCRVAIIAGTGFEAAIGNGDRNHTIQTPYGEAELSLVTLEMGDIAIVTRHGKGHVLPPHKVNHRANLWMLREVGVEFIMATAATGSLRIDRQPGDIIALDDFIDFRGTVTTISGAGDDPFQHTDFSSPFSSIVRQAILTSADEISTRYSDLPKIFRNGTYICVSGPRYETPAEIRMFASWGADVVGMTVAPEAILAKELAIDYAALAIVTNLGTGLSDRILLHTDVSKQMEHSNAFLVTLLRRAANKLFDRGDS